MKSVLTVIGTRPEAIKLAPVLKAIDKNARFTNKVCITGQHTDLLDPFLLNLGIIVDYRFKNYENEGALHQSAAHILEQFGAILTELKPDLVLVQGDTTTAFVAALAAFYARIPVGHVEAGLRTGHLYSPWPEEMHRCLIDRLATYFFAPTDQARNTLLAEGVSPEKVWVVGNTSIDALRLARKYSKLTRDPKSRVIVVTIHRRENHGEPLKEICHALRVIVGRFSDVRIVFFLHPNPAVRKPVTDMLSEVINIDLVEPVDHPSFIQLLDTCGDLQKRIRL
ncbi:MAG: UDP-N-acetylglucosamine 2-epimerase (non-hydrolyzing) [Caedimonas sp.]|nr:UDP-N-acetylglucosamine 2-epimerase (non-hydrolyzing) [Caedimonas sp.]